MLITLTDRLTCPRCGPKAGLIVLIDEVVERRVVRGSLGCPTCRERYTIEGRVADLRVGGSGGAAGASRARARAGTGAAAEAVVRVAALLGLNEGSGFVLVDGPDALGVATELPELAPDYEAVVLVDASRGDEASSEPVSALMVDAALPMANSLMRGAAYVGGAPDAARLTELARVVRPTGKVLVDGAVAADLDAAADVLEGLGAQVRARDEQGLVAVMM